MLCKQVAKFEFVHSLRDDKTRHAYRCNICGHIQLLPLPTMAEDNDFYQHDKMYKSIYTDKRNFQEEANLMYRYRPFALEQVERIERLIHKDNRPKILDIGTGYGWLVEFLRGRGFDADGVELSDEKRELCKNRSGIDIFGWNFLVDCPEAREKDGYYDVICLMETLEHISDPTIFLSRAGKLLKPGGMIYVDVPNFDDYMKAELPEYEDFTYARMHLSYFTPKTLEFCLENSGFIGTKIYGQQTYSFENTLWWLREKRPFKDYPQIDVPQQLEWLNKIYKERLECSLKSNILVAVAYKK
jgi:2-polyprenyl-3-methyl-5-hydroxy-6-metoxy-1,4-benzoquinol methylase